MRSRALWMPLALALGIAGGIAAQSSGSQSHPTVVRRVAQPAAPPPARLPRVGVFGQGSWCWFADPRAVRVMGRYDSTFVGWIDWSGRITVGAYDARFGVVETHVVGQLLPDDHGSPAILADRNGRLTVFWSGHNGPTMFYRTTLRPEDISAWGPVQRVRSQLKGDLGFTYANPVLLPAERYKLYLFWRGANWSADYETRTIDGRWSRARELIVAPGQRPYLKVETNGSDTIALAFTNGHPRERITNVYYAAYRAGSLWHADGRRITRLAAGPISPRRADLVYNGRAKGVSGWVWDLALDRRQRPVIVYATFPSPLNHRYWYAHWNGRRWVSHFMTFAGPTISPTTIEQQYSGGLTLDHADPSIVYLSRKRRGWFEIEKWTTPDGGDTWHRRTVERSPGTDDLRPVVPRGAGGGPIKLLWLRGQYGSYWEYRTSVAFLR